MSKSGRTEMWPDGQSALGFGQFGQHLALLACRVGKFCSLLKLCKLKGLMTWFQLILPVPNHDVTKNLTGHRMPRYIPNEMSD